MKCPKCGSEINHYDEPIDITHDSGWCDKCKELWGFYSLGKAWQDRVEKAEAVIEKINEIDLDDISDWAKLIQISSAICTYEKVKEA